MQVTVDDLILEVDDDVHHDEGLGRQDVLSAFSTFLQPRLKRLVCPANTVNTDTRANTVLDLGHFQGHASKYLSGAQRHENFFFIFGPVKHSHIQTVLTDVFQVYLA